MQFQGKARKIQILTQKHKSTTMVVSGMENQSVEARGWEVGELTTKE